MTRTKTARIALTSAIVYILGMGLANAIVHNVSRVNYGDADYIAKMIPFLALLAAGSVCLFLIKRKQLAPSFEGRRRLRLFLVMFIPMVCMALYYCATNVELSAAFMTPLIGTLLVGIAEEMMFRRILYVGLLGEPNGRSIKGALLISSLTFSLLHAVNVLAGSPLSNVLTQLGATFIAGLFFAFMYERTQSILLMIVFHFLWDYLLLSGATLKVPPFGIAMGALNIAQFIIVVVLLVQKWKQEKAAGPGAAQQAAVSSDADRARIAPEG